MQWNLPTALEAPSLAVETRSLRKTYGKVTALDGLDLSVPEGAVYLLVGPNGAGKTTTFSILMGLLRPDGGEARMLGVAAGPNGVARAGIGFVPETGERGYGWMRVRHLIDHHSRYYPNWDGDYQLRLEKRLDIRLDQKLKTLSKGQARRVQLLLALAHRPPLLLLDEPTEGLDPVARDAVLAGLTEHLAQTPTTVVVATHLVYEMERLADYVGVLRQGRLVAQLDRATFHDRLRRYVFEAPDGWTPGPDLNVIRRNGGGRERRWVIWGEESDVSQRLRSGGVTVWNADTLTLDEAAVALLGEEVE